ncbi:transcription antitermination factor NusB [Candidatus Bipolaricaulota bacterium]|nr:transcription antitermination factor NusB [Candidatus Bipolaricaulota bacterium]
MRRTEARELVLLGLYRREHLEFDLEELFEERDPGDQRGYVIATYQGIFEHIDEIDALLEARTVGWRLKRLGWIDRNILRLAAYELLHAKDVPPEVVINEAVELSKMYGTDNAPSFINGILDRLLQVRRAEESGDEGDDENQD